MSRGVDGPTALANRACARAAHTLRASPWRATCAALAALVWLALAPCASAGGARDPLETFRSFLGRLERRQVVIDDRTIGELGLAVGDLRLLWGAEPERAHDIASALLDLVGATLASYQPVRRETLEPAVQTARSSAADALDARWNGDLVSWLTRTVLADAHGQPLARRRAAAWMLVGRHVPGSELALLSTTRDADPRLRDIATEALAGFSSDVVHRFFVEELSRAREAEAAPGGATSPAARTAASGDPLRALAERHFRGVRIEAGSAAIPGLIRLVRAEIVETDWRRASQAIVLSHALPDEQIVPWLIEGLQTWKERGEKGLQALRIEHEIELQLEQRSGRKLGLHAENWSAWWEAVKAGRVKQVSTPSGWPEPTRPSFFGLDPRSDRVLFVIDRSGSMASPFDPAKTQAPNTRVRTRWQEATEQLLDFARALGERARLGIVLFHANADPWRAHLVPANERNLAAARSWLVGQKPDGGTELRRGIEEGLHVAPDGSFDLEAIEADTVIVLCDGATAEGPAWVPAFLERVNAGLRVVFHCVQIGEGGDGTLEELAKGSGGEFVRIVR